MQLAIGGNFLRVQHTKKRVCIVCSKKSRSCRRNLVQNILLGSIVTGDSMQCSKEREELQQACNQVMPLLRFVFSGSRCPAAACCCSWCCTMGRMCEYWLTNEVCVCVASVRVCVLHVVFVVATLVCGTLRDPLGVAAAASLPWGAKCVAIYGKDRTVLYVPMCLLSNYVRTIWKICLHILHKLSKSPRGQWLKSNRKWNRFRGIPNINIPKNMAGFQCRSKGIRLVFIFNYLKKSTFTFISNTFKLFSFSTLFWMCLSCCKVS